MAICANQGRMYMGTARQYMERQSGSCVQPAARCDSCERRDERVIRQIEDGCEPESMCADLPLGVAYVNPQPYTGLVSGEMALSRGSAFNNFYDPWTWGKQC